MRVGSELKKIAAEMFELMYQAKGIGLAANQVDLPIQLFIINISGEKGSGEPLVFINPVIDQPKGTGTAEEGCLSIPGVNGLVARPSRIHVSAYDLSGNEIDMTADGLLARAIQHEVDHLNGTLFIDRLSDSEMRQVEPDLEEFELDFASRRESGEIKSDSEIRQRLEQIEDKYC